MVRRNNNRSKQKRKLSRKMRGGAVTKSNMPVCQLIYKNKIYHADSLLELIEWARGYPDQSGVAEPDPAEELDQLRVQIAKLKRDIGGSAPAPEPEPAQSGHGSLRSDGFPISTASSKEHSRQRLHHGPSGLGRH